MASNPYVYDEPTVLERIAKVQAFAEQVAQAARDEDWLLADVLRRRSLWGRLWWLLTGR